MTRDPATKKEWLASLREHTYPSVTVIPEWVYTAAAAIVALLILGGIQGCATVPAAAPVVIPVHVVEHDGVKMRMLPTPCADAVSKLLAAQMSPPQYHQQWKATSSDWKHRDGSWHEYAGCWLEVAKEDFGTPDAIIFFTFSDGTSGQVLKGELIKPAGRGA